MRHVAVDWSGAKSPAGKIWLAEARDGRLERLESFPTRASVVQWIAACLLMPEPAVVGLDFAFSFPAWYCAHLGAHSATDVWRVVASDGERWLETCAWPFWGRPGQRCPDLPEHLRRTEWLAGRRLKTRPKSTFQIGGAGAVGTGSLRGMPHLLELQDAGCAVWPFGAAGHVTIVELYPRLLTGPVTKSRPECRAAYLQDIARLWSPQHRLAAEASEDAFDAVVSALEMNARWQTLPEPHTLDRLFALEGLIWDPAGAYSLRNDAG